MHLLTEARLTYHVAVGAALRDSLDAGDQTMRYLMTQLKQVIKDDLGNESDRERKNTRNRESRIARSEEQTVISRMLP